ncbi:MAG: undecaprenyl diphosphate synthase family protein, partial [Raoultibacter sp.]
MNKSVCEIFPHPPAGLDPAALVVERIPRHVAIIMDGNGRWAQQRGKNRLEGHSAGISSVRESIRCASD